ncbi:MAG: UDP-N-acetylmuramate--L-alanine ligase [Actinomycetota bacterium]|nr:UDP-N-acetylmuramate--L-alanine ligase [Actinomycetota bacterium]
MRDITRTVGADDRGSAAVPHRVHLVGVGGAGMSAIARILAQRGHAVSGSDLHDGRAITALRVLGVRIHVGHDAANVADSDVVVISSAVSADNPEVVAAVARGIPVVPRAQVLADTLAGDRAVLVAGTHGKTTTTSMIVVALHAAGVDPTFAIGGELNEAGTNAHAGSDRVAVAEADESDRSFLAYEPDVAVVTNLELDHPEVYRDLDDVLDAFTAFLARRRPGGVAVVCADDPGVRRLLQRIDGPVVTYGTAADAEVRLVERDGQPHVLVDDVAHPLALGVPGQHNLLNAVGAVVTCRALGAPMAGVLEGLARFRGAARRFQRLGEVDGVSVVDDYAHHPTELRATLAAARSTGAARIVCVVQPHRYSRTAVLGAELGRAAAGADIVIVTEVYGAGERAVPGVNGALVAEAARAAGARVTYEPHLGSVAGLLADEVRSGDLVLITGAGDVSQVGPSLLALLGGR